MIVYILYLRVPCIPLLIIINSTLNEVIIMAVSKHTRKSSGRQWIKQRNIAKTIRKRLEREQIKRDRLRKIRKIHQKRR